MIRDSDSVNNTIMRICSMLENSALKHEALLSVPSFVNKKMLVDAIQISLETNPRLYMIESYDILENNGSCYVKPYYFYNMHCSADYLRACNEVVNRLTKRFGLSTEYDTVLNLHDCLARNVSYQDTGKESHSMIGPLLAKTAVCEGFAKAFKFILDKLSIENVLVVGSAYNQNRKQDERHSWNLVKLNKTWCHIDVTFDSTIRTTDMMRHDYFGLSDTDIRKDHSFASSSYPEAVSNENSYYERNNMIMRKKSDLKAEIIQCLSSGKNEVVFKLPDKGNSDGLLEQVDDVINDSLCSCSQTTAYSLFYNSAQRVFHFRAER